MTLYSLLLEPLPIRLRRSIIHNSLIPFKLRDIINVVIQRSSLLILFCLNLLWIYITVMFLIVRTIDTVILILTDHLVNWKTFWQGRLINAPGWLEYLQLSSHWRILHSQWPHSQKTSNRLILCNSHWMHETYLPTYVHWGFHVLVIS